MNPDFSSTTGPTDPPARSFVRSASGRSDGGRKIPRRLPAYGDKGAEPPSDSDLAGSQLGEGRSSQPKSLPEPYYQDEAVTIYHGPAEDLLPQLEVDALVTDPPYNVGFNYGTGRSDIRQDYVSWLNGLFSQARASTLVWFPGTANLLNVSVQLDGTGFEVRRVLGWHRKEFAGDKWSNGPAMSWEPIIWATRGPQTFNKIFGTWGRDFFVVDATHGDRARFGHPCPKPKRVMDWLVALFVPIAGTVLDPFMGSGTTLRAAKDLNRKAIGIEIEERFCEVAARRMGQEVLVV